MHFKKDTLISFLLIPSVILLVCVLSDINYFLHDKSIYHINSLASSTLLYIKIKIQDFQALNFIPRYWLSFISSGVPFNSGLSVYNPLLIIVSFFKNFSDSLIAYDILLKFIGGLGAYFLLRKYKYSIIIAASCSLIYPLNPFAACLGQDPQFSSVIFFMPWIILELELIIENIIRLKTAFIFALILALTLSLCYLAANIQSYIFLFCFVIFPYVFLRLYVFKNDGDKDGENAVKKPALVLSLIILAIFINFLLIIFEVVPTLTLFKIGNRIVDGGDNIRIIVYPFLLILLVICLKYIFNSKNILLQRLSFLLIVLTLIFSSGKKTIYNLFIANYLCKIQEINFVFASQPLMYYFTLLQLFLLIIVLLKRRFFTEKKYILFYVLVSYFILNLLFKLKLDFIFPFLVYYSRYAFISALGIIIGLAEGLDIIKTMSTKGKIYKYIFIVLLIILPLENYSVYLNRTLFSKGLSYIEHKGQEYEFLKNIKPTERVIDVYENEHPRWGKTFNPWLMPKWLIPPYFGANTFSQVGINIIPRRNAEYNAVALPLYFGIDKKKPLPPLLNLAGVKYIYSYDKIGNNDSLKLLKKADEYYIYENLEVMPRIMLIPNVEYFEPKKTLSALSKQTNKEFLKKVYVDINEKKISLSNSGENKVFLMNNSEFISNLGAIRINKYEDEYIEVDCKIRQECVFMITDTYFNGWKAYIGEKENEIIRCDYIYRGIKLYPGNYVLIMKYMPIENRWSLMVSFTTLIIVVLLLISFTLFGRKHEGK